jgi:outer membrane protein TolC
LAAGVTLADLDAEQARVQVTEVRAGFLPRVDISESWQRGNQPVFAFGSLLAQRRFTEADFDVARLNGPDPLDNFRAAVTVEQAVFDPRLFPQVHGAGIAHGIAEARVEQARQDAAIAAVTAYGEVLRFDALGQSAEAAEQAATADLDRAERRRDQGVATDADVLAVTVHLADVRARLLTAAAEEQVARAALNDVIGAPLDSLFTLTPVPDVGPPEPLDALEAEALDSRVDRRIAVLERQMAETEVRQARAAFLPQVVVRGALEWNGGQFSGRARSWIVGTEVRLNLSAGPADRARLTRARLARQAREVREREAADRVRLDVRAARARVDAALARLRVADAAVGAAREAQRIIRDRYDAGLADIVAVLDAAEAVLDTQARLITARVDLSVQQALLEAAVGR